MAIRRENILSLIGNGRYHSCILTTFSFDFYFFELQAIKTLRSCGVRNVNVFIDGYYYSELMQEATGDEMKFASGYSLYPIFGKGLFHPKIWMLFGEDEGLLIVGSGNLTFSGGGGNDELWGAFHFNSKQTDHSELFASAWKYLNQISGTAKGITADKTTRWIAEHSPWLSSLPKASKAGFTTLANKDEATILFNQQGKGILAQLRDLVGKEKITEITVASPFYDAKGKAIEAIQNEFPATTVNIVVEESGTLPHAMAANKKHTFFSWKQAGITRSIGADQKSRLHGKLLHLKTAKGVEYCLFGSANITPEGLGLTNSPNAEACLLLRNSKGGIIERVGLKLKNGGKKSLAHLNASPEFSIYQTVVKNNRFPIQLFAVDLSYSSVTVYSEGQAHKKLDLGIYDEQGSLIRRLEVSEYQPTIEIKIDIDESRIKYAQFLDNISGTPVSNKILVSHYQLARPGFAWNRSAEEFINHFGDVVYNPILLPQVTIVDI